ncbi:tetracycline-efflux transporter-like protein [Geopyxis carbonaria]|nr:tetracycline-efflux transporter-like protein [Geopyxis carbonaria]
MTTHRANVGQTEAALEGSNTSEAIGNAGSYLDRAGGDSAAESQPLLAGANAAGSDLALDEAEGAEYNKDWEGYPWWKRPSVFWLLPPFCLFSLAFGSVAVPRLNIILDLNCREYFAEQNSHNKTHYIMPVVGGSDNEQCQIAEVHARTSEFILVMGLVAGLISALTSPRLGSLSDRYGRRALMAFSSFGLLVSEITTIIAVMYPDSINVNIMLVGAVCDGLCGSFMLGMALAYSYGADCTNTKHRAMAFGAFQGCLFLGIAAGPVLGGLMVEETGDILSIFWVALSAHIFFIFYVTFLLPESLPKRRQLIAREKHIQEKLRMGASTSWWSSMHPWEFLRPLSVLFPTSPGSTPRLRLNMVLLALIDCTIFGVGMGSMTVIIMYAEKEFHWRNLESSIYLSVVNSTRVTMLFVVLPILITIYRRGKTTQKTMTGSDMLDINLIRFAIVVEAVGYLGYAVSGTGAMFTLAGALTALGGVGSPTVQSTLTKHIPKEKTGQLLGAMALLHSLARVVAPAVFNLIYAMTVGTVPQTVFVFLGSAFSVAFVCSWFIRPHISWRDEGAVDTPQQDEQA